MDYFYAVDIFKDGGLYKRISGIHFLHSTDHEEMINYGENIGKSLMTDIEDSLKLTHNLNEEHYIHFTALNNIQ